jgi:hypothetical protein
MNARTTLASALLLMAAAPALAQVTERSFKLTSKDCSGVEWSRAALERHPDIASACDSVAEKDGRAFVNFNAEVVRTVDRGRQIEVKFKNGETMMLSPPEDKQVYIDGRAKNMRELQRGDDVTFHIPEDRLVAQFHEEETPTQQIVLVPIIYREANLADVRDSDARQASALPATASDLPLAAVLGAGLLGLGCVATLRRLGKR